MPTLSRIRDTRSDFVTTLPGTTLWLARGKTSDALQLGTLDGAAPRPIALDRSVFKHSVVAMRGLPDRRVVMSDGAAVAMVRLRDDGASFELIARWDLPGEMGWRASVAASADGARMVVASDGRLGVFGSDSHNVVRDTGLPGNFWNPAFLPDGRTVVVGRGDGRVELRDATTLEVRRTFSPLGEAVLALCVLDAVTVAVADDDAVTGLLDLETGRFEALELSRMKTSGLHLLSDGRLVVVGLSRRVTVFRGSRRERGQDLAAELGDRYIQASALASNTLVVACEEAGLCAVDLDALPEQSAPPESPFDAVAYRAQVTVAVELQRLVETLAGKRDVTDLVRKLLAHDDEATLRTTFVALMNAQVPLPDAAAYLASPRPRVRYYAADHFGEIPAAYRGRGAELHAALADADPTVAAAAAWSIGRLEDRTAVALLVALLDHLDRNVQATACAALVALREGSDAIASAIRAGAGELSMNVFVALQPELTPALAERLPPEVVARLVTGVPARALIDAAGLEASAEFLAAHGDDVVPFPHVTALRRVDAAVAAVSATRWAIVRHGDTLAFATHASSADAWRRALRERSSA